MWIVAWSTGTETNLRDRWMVVETEAEAVAEYEKALALDDLYCAAMAPISRGTEPHWTAQT